MSGGNKIVFMATRKGRKTPRAAPVVRPQLGGNVAHAHPQDLGHTWLFGDRDESDNWEPALKRLYELLDALVAWRVGFANGTDGDKALSAIGRAKVLEVRTVLDTAIYNIKSAIDDVERQRPQK